MKVAVISPRKIKGRNIKGFKVKASSAMKANGNFLIDTIFICCCRFWNNEQVSINCNFYFTVVVDTYITFWPASSISASVNS